MEASWLRTWGYNLLNITAGDWVRLAVPATGLNVEQPLLATGGMILTGIDGAATVGGLASLPMLRCGPNASSVAVVK